MDKLLIFLETLLVALASIPAIPAEFPTPLLSVDYYEKTCPLAVPIVSQELQLATLKEARMAASILLLHFHDSCVQGCDASVLLDDTQTFKGEKTANPNINSIRGFEVIDAIKERLETACPGVVSCADILALAARDGVVLSGGPYWDVPVGRKDSKTASLVEANINIPMPVATIQNLIVSHRYGRIGWGHTIGQARCTSFRQRLYNDPTAGNDPYLSGLKAICPASGGDDNLSPLDHVSPTLFDNSYYINLVNGEGLLPSGDDNLSPLDHVSPTLFDNSYYINLVNGEGLLPSDQEMYSSGLGSITGLIVKEYATEALGFAKHFSESMVKMGNIVNPATLLAGEVRKNCRRVNQ